MTFTPPNYNPPTDPAKLLADAQWKLHLLQTGRLSVEVEVDGRKVRYSRVNIDVLKSYIDELTDAVNGRTPRYGAVGFIF